MNNLLTTLIAFLALALSTHAGILQKDFTGIGHIYVLKSSDWRTATPKSKVGCLNDHGKFVSDAQQEDCGVFARLEDFPYTLSSKAGNCTFDDETQEKNSDSHYGKTDNAWNCNKEWKSDIYDELYTIDGFPYVFLCFGDIACYYDAKSTPDTNDTLSLWQFRWGSEQRGITPGHVQLQLMWKKLGELPKREGEKAVVPGPRVEVSEGAQVPLMGGRARA
ncbi:Nn.00g075600.m01.CDS01 [Neocucurbitaria sp. VM-36]